MGDTATHPRSRPLEPPQLHRKCWSEATSRSLNKEPDVAFGRLADAGSARLRRWPRVGAAPAMLRLMELVGDRVVLVRITPDLAQRICVRDERPGDAWHAEYPFADELDPLRALATATDPDPVFTMYLVRRVADGLAVGGIGFFGPPDGDGCVELGYGLVPSARGAGLASEAVTLALAHAARAGARAAVADAEVDNGASRRVLVKAGFVEVGRDGSLVRYGRALDR